jgi:hypothetical protein
LQTSSLGASVAALAHHSKQKDAALTEHRGDLAIQTPLTWRPRLYAFFNILRPNNAPAPRSSTFHRSVRHDCELVWDGCIGYFNYKISFPLEDYK